MIKKWLNDNIDEIKNVRALHCYGAALSIIFSFQSLYWWKTHAGDNLSIKSEAICWPFFYDCSRFRLFNVQGNLIIFFLIGFFAIFNSILFYKKKIKLAFMGLIFLELVSFIIILLDYRLRLNQNIMIFFTVISFLFIKSKENVIPKLLVFFYFWAGLLKIRPEWITGKAIYGHLLLIPDNWKSQAAIYVIVLELFFIWGLLFKNKFLKCFTLL